MTTASSAGHSHRPQPAGTQLAIHGGTPAFSGCTGPSEPKIGVAEFLAIAERFGFKPQVLDQLRSTLRDEDLPQGGPNLARYWSAKPKPPAGEKFEAMAREKFSTRHALSTSSGTGALHAAMVAVGAGPGKEVIVPALGFMATAAAAALAGATPVFCDIDESMQIDPTRIESLINERTVAIAPTHHWGVVCDMDPIIAIARRHDLKVVEDCAQSPGASYKGCPVGSIGDVGCFSISAYKIIGGGEGGMVVTSDDRLYDRARQLAECGGLWRKDRFAPPQYEGELFVGTNYRLSELESAVNTVQMAKLDGIVSRHRAAMRRVLGQLPTCREITPQKLNDPAGVVGYSVRFFPRTHELAAQLRDALKAEGVHVGYRGPASRPDWHIYSDMFPLACSTQARLEAGLCPVADDLYRRELSLGIDQWWSPEDCDAVAAGISRVLEHYCTVDPSAPGWLRA